MDWYPKPMFTAEQVAAGVSFCSSLLLLKMCFGQVKPCLLLSRWPQAFFKITCVFFRKETYFWQFFGQYWSIYGTAYLPSYLLYGTAYVNIGTNSYSTYIYINMHICIYKYIYIYTYICVYTYIMTWQQKRKWDKFLKTKDRLVVY